MTVFYDPVTDEFHGRIGGVDTVIDTILRNKIIPIDLASGDVNGILGVPNGGTGSNSFTAGSIIFSDGSILTQNNSALFWDDINRRLGFGTLTPIADIHISKTAESAALRIERFSNDVIPGNFQMAKSRGTASVPLQILAGDILFNFNAFGRTNTGIFGNSGSMRMWATENFTGTGWGTYLEISLTETGTVSLLPKLTLSDRANLGIGITTNPNPTAGTNGLFFQDGTVPSGLLSNTAGLYSNDVSGTVNMFAINEAGESTRLSWPTPQTYTETNVTTDRAFDADTVVLTELADVVGTLIADLRARGIIN